MKEVLKAILFCFLVSILLARMMPGDRSVTMQVDQIESQNFDSKHQESEPEIQTFRIELTKELSRLLLEKEAVKKQEDLSAKVVNKEITYVTKKGDTLSRISLMYGTTVKNILAVNPDIKDANIIRVNQNITIIGATTFSSGSKLSSAKSKERRKSCPQIINKEEKIAILKKVEKRTNVPWEFLAGLAMQESGFGAAPVGDSGKSHGYFHISFFYHKGITLAQANDWEWSSNWAADHLVKLGFISDPVRAMRLWNGSLKNPRTLKHVENVLALAKRDFGLDSRYDSLLLAQKNGGTPKVVNHQEMPKPIIIASLSEVYDASGIYVR